MTELSLPVLKLINEARSTYGLRHHDFARYHSHCTTKVHHLRKAVGLVQVASKLRKYTKKDVTAANAATDKHLQILLFDAERAWAHSQLLKSTLSLSTTSPAAKQHLARRLSRAVLRADNLLSLATELVSKLSVSDRAQVAAYYLVLKGTLAFEQQRHQEGLNALSVAQSLLTTIAATSNTAHDEALANEAIDDLEPMLRFCAYTLQLDISSGASALVKSTTEREKERLIKGYDAMVDELHKNGGRIRREAVELKWRDQDIPVRNAQLVSVILKVQTALHGLAADKDVVSSSKKKSSEGGRRETLGARRMGTYDRALLVLSEAQDVATQLVEDNRIASRVSSARSESAAGALQRALAFITFQLLSVRTKRDLLLIEDTRAKLAGREAKIRKAEADFVVKTGSKDPRTAETKIRKQRARVYPGLVKVYDGIVQNLEQTRDLEAVEQDGELSAIVEARIALVRASRALVLSRSYALVDQFPSALSLNARAKLYAREARAAASSLDAADENSGDFDFAGDLLPLTASEFDRLDRELLADSERASHDWYAATGGVTEPEDLAIAGLELQGEDSALKKKKKEAFYDVAFNYVVAFDMDAIAAKAGLKAPVEDVADVAMPDALEAKEKQPSPAAQAPTKGWGFGLFGSRK